MQFNISSLSIRSRSRLGENIRSRSRLGNKLGSRSRLGKKQEPELAGAAKKLTGSPARCYKIPCMNNAESR